MHEVNQSHQNFELRTFDFEYDDKENQDYNSQEVYQNPHAAPRQIRQSLDMLESQRVVEPDENPTFIEKKIPVKVVQNTSPNSLRYDEDNNQSNLFDLTQTEQEIVQNDIQPEQYKKSDFHPKSEYTTIAHNPQLLKAVQARTELKHSISDAGSIAEGSIVVQNIPASKIQCATRKDDQNPFSQNGCATTQLNPQALARQDSDFKEVVVELLNSDNPNWVPGEEDYISSGNSSGYGDSEEEDKEDFYYIEQEGNKGYRLSAKNEYEQRMGNGYTEEEKTRNQLLRDEFEETQKRIRESIVAADEEQIKQMFSQYQNKKRVSGYKKHQVEKNLKQLRRQRQDKTDHDSWKKWLKEKNK